MRRRIVILSILAAATAAIVLLRLDRAFFISRWLPSSLRDSICENVRIRTTAPIRLAELTPFAWERVYIFYPYSSAESAQRALGFEWDGFEETGISFSDAFKLLVFVDGSRVVESLRYPRDCGDFEVPDQQMRSAGLSKEHAVFVLSAEEHRGPWQVLRPAAQAEPAAM